MWFILLDKVVCALHMTNMGTTSGAWVVEASMIRRAEFKVKGNGRYMSNTVLHSILHATPREKKEYGKRI